MSSGRAADTCPQGLQRMRNRLGKPRLGRGGDAPTAGHRLDRFVRPIGVQPGPQMADFGGGHSAAAINLAIDDQPAADAAADGDIEHDAAPAAGAELRLGQPGHVAIVSDGGRQPNVRCATNRPSGKSCQPSI